MSPRLGPPETPYEHADEPEALAWDAHEDGYSMLPFVLHEPIQWRDAQDPPEEGDWYEVHVPTQDRWRRVRDHWIPALEALGKGMTLPEAHEHAAEAMPERPRSHIRYIIRKVTRKLLKWDMATVVLPALPEAFEDRYERVEELGRGGMGLVWRCRDLQHPDEREVAVKHAWNWRGTLAGRDESLREEARMMREADHPGIVTPLDAFEVDGRFHLVRELLEGPELVDLDRDRLRGVAERSRLLEEVVDVLVHLRELGYLCLDVKAGNFMLDGEKGPLKMVDLGLCKELEDGRVPARGFPGTRAYQDPALLERDHATEASTVYAVGRILWRLTTGDSPTPRAHYESYFEQHELDLDALAESDATEAEMRLYEDACSPEPEDRPPSLEAFRDRLPA